MTSKNRTKRIALIVFSLIIVFSTLQEAAAFGVTAPYWKENPITMALDETKKVTFTLQNMVGDEEIAIAVEIVKDKNYLTHLGDSNIYIVPAKTKDIEVPFELHVPSTAKPGEVLPVEINFLTTSQAGSGQLALGMGITKVFDIVVSGEPIKVEGQQIAEETQVPLQRQDKQSKIKPLTKEDLIPALVIFILVLLFWIILQRIRMKKMKHGEDGFQKKNQHDIW
jgi:hypothetical protein